jgi:hypothetical protein
MLNAERWFPNRRTTRLFVENSYIREAALSVKR